ncbi:hypothetical protein ACNVED_11405 [Legionella sp. D16C41]|uniref:hypothetical protein n=1 Tax=Legionella sp. D16C41 TaxID=3402688 RepID=UPI003AF940E4
MPGNNYPSANKNNLSRKGEKESYIDSFFAPKPKKASLVGKDSVSIVDSFLGTQPLQEDTESQSTDNFFDLPLQEGQFLTVNYNLPPSTISKNFSHVIRSSNAPVYLQSDYQASIVNNNNLQPYRQPYINLSSGIYPSSSSSTYPQIFTGNLHFPRSYSQLNNRESQVYQRAEVSNSPIKSPKQKSKRSKPKMVDPNTGNPSNAPDAVTYSTYYNSRLVDPNTGNLSNASNAVPRSTYYQYRLVDPNTGNLSNASNAVPYRRYITHKELEAKIQMKNQQLKKLDATSSSAASDQIGESEEVASQNVNLKKLKVNDTSTITTIDSINPDNSLVDLPIDNDTFFDNSSTELLPNYSTESQGIENDNVASLYELNSEDVSHSISAASSIESVNENDFTLFKHVEMPPPSYSSGPQKVGNNQSESALANQSLFNCKSTKQLSEEKNSIETPSNEFDDLANSFEAEFKFSTSN